MPIPASTAPMPFGIDGKGAGRAMGAGCACRPILSAWRAIDGIVPWAHAHSNADGCEVMPGRHHRFARCRGAKPRTDGYMVATWHPETTKPNLVGWAKLLISLVPER